MIIYFDEDGPYLSWVGHHRDGFVIDWLRKPTRRAPILHRATCTKIRISKSKKTHWTTGRRLKACSANLGELVAWAEQESGHEPAYCEDCVPQQEAPPAQAADHGHITKFGMKILDYVIEAAVICLDNEDAAYDLTVGSIADYLGKTTGQIAGPLLRLIQTGDLRLDPDAGEETELRGAHRVFPTSQALRMLPAFQKLSAQEIDDELAELTAGAD